MLACFQCIQAQDPTLRRIYETMPTDPTAIARTQSTHAIDIGLFNAGYTYEFAFAKKFTISLSTGVVGAIDAIGLFSTNWYDIEWMWYYSFHPYVSIEPRYYYNLQRQLNKGASIEGNSGAFWAVQCGYILKPFAQKNVHYDKAIFVVAPYWGARKVWKYHYLVEFQLGIVFDTLNINRDDSESGIKTGFRFAYRF